VVRRALRADVFAAAIFVLAAGTACSKPSVEPMQLERGTLTVSNQSNQDWTHVEIWLNRSYRVTTTSIPAKTRFQVPLDSFVAGFGQRFDPKRAQVEDLRLNATLSDGQPLELKKAFTASGLAGALGGKR
jgi:hypothetical protein